MTANTRTTPYKDLYEDNDVDVMEPEQGEPAKLILHNDNVNTFQHVANALMDICKHDMEAAMQCALLVHTKGQYVVKKGDKKELTAMKEEFLNRGIDASVSTKKLQ